MERQGRVTMRFFESPYPADEGKTKTIASRLQRRQMPREAESCWCCRLVLLIERSRFMDVEKRVQVLVNMLERSPASPAVFRVSDVALDSWVPPTPLMSWWSS